MYVAIILALSAWQLPALYLSTYDLPGGRRKCAPICPARVLLGDTILEKCKGTRPAPATSSTTAFLSDLVLVARSTRTATGLSRSRQTRWDLLATTTHCTAAS